MSAPSPIITEIRNQILAQLTERRQVLLQHLGTLEAEYEPPYLLQQDDGSQLLMPPHLSLRFVPEGELLNSNNYKQPFVTPPHLQGLDMVALAAADMLQQPYDKLLPTLQEYLDQLLRNLYSGKRVSLFGVADLYVIDGREGREAELLCEVEPAVSALLNKPFDHYRPEPLLNQALGSDLATYATNDYESMQRAKASYLLRAASIDPEPLEEETTIISSPIVEEIAIVPSVSEPVTIAVETVTAPPKQPSTKKWLWSGIGLILIVLLAYLFAPIKKGETPSAVEPTPTVIVQPDTTAVPPISDTPIDTVQVSTGMTLYKYAQQYYGNQLFWVYIYIENAQAIKDANNLSKGTSLVIPALVKYVAEPESNIAVQEAKIWEYYIQAGHYTDYATQLERVRQRAAQSS